jgi:hypothetical protein
MTKRIVLAGVVAGIAMFVWTSLAHMVLPLGATGVQEIPNEAPALAALQNSIGNAHGLYLFPGFGLGTNPTMKQMNAAMPEHDKKLATSPSGLLIYFPPGRPAMSGGQLATEFGNELAEALLAVFLLSLVRLRSYGARVGFVFVIGLISALPTNVSYWNWYGFPGNYTVAYTAIQVIGFLVVGLVAAGMVKPAPAQASAAAA